MFIHRVNHVVITGGTVTVSIFGGIVAGCGNNSVSSAAALL